MSQKQILIQNRPIRSLTDRPAQLKPFGSTVHSEKLSVWVGAWQYAIHTLLQNLEMIKFKQRSFSDLLRKDNLSLLVKWDVGRENTLCKPILEFFLLLAKKNPTNTLSQFYDQRYCYEIDSVVILNIFHYVYMQYKYSLLCLPHLSSVVVLIMHMLTWDQHANLIQTASYWYTSYITAQFSAIKDRFRVQTDVVDCRGVASEFVRAIPLTCAREDPTSKEVRNSYTGCLQGNAACYHLHHKFRSNHQQQQFHYEPNADQA